MSTGFTIFGLTVHYYGIIIMIGAVLAAHLGPGVIGIFVRQQAK